MVRLVPSAQLLERKVRLYVVGRRCRRLRSRAVVQGGNNSHATRLGGEHGTVGEQQPHSRGKRERATEGGAQPSGEQAWGEDGRRLRVLNTRDSLEDYAEEINPNWGTLYPTFFQISS